MTICMDELNTSIRVVEEMIKGFEEKVNTYKEAHNLLKAEKKRRDTA